MCVSVSMYYSYNFIMHMLGPILAPVQFRNWAPSSGTGTSPNEHCVHFWLQGSPLMQVCVLKSAQCSFGVLWAPSARTGLVPDWVPTHTSTSVLCMLKPILAPFQFWHWSPSSRTGTPDYPNWNSPIFYVGAHLGINLI